MSFLGRLPGVSKARRVVSETARAAWSRDRAQLGWFRALGNRMFRIAILVLRGFVAHRVTMLAASLTFYTVFSVVPMLVVVLWTLKLTDHLPVAPVELYAQQPLVTGDQLLHVALAEIFGAVERAGEVTGLVGLLALLYVAGKMFSFTERALYTIAGSGRQRPRPARALGYLALLLMLPVVVGVVGVLQAAARFFRSIRTEFEFGRLVFRSSQLLFELFIEFFEAVLEPLNVFFNIVPSGFCSC